MHTENTLHQLAPYIGKMKSTMAATLVERYTRSGDVVADPFMGSGTVGLEAVLRGRAFVGWDVNPYAHVLGRAKLEAPPLLSEALEEAERHITEMEERIARGQRQRRAPEWVKEFFHPRTLREVSVIVDVLREREAYFTLACLMGVLHHQRPGFLSFPSSHLVPYLRTNKFPREDHPEMYGYRDVRSRLVAKVRRAYRRGAPPPTSRWAVHHGDFAEGDAEAPTVDAIITSPPYMNALDYARDNRLRMWFLGVRQFRAFDRKLNTRDRFVHLMRGSLQKMSAMLRPGGLCVLVVGAARRKKVSVPNGQIVTSIALEEVGRFELVETAEDQIPDVRRARRNGSCTKAESIIVLRRT